MVSVIQNLPADVMVVNSCPKYSPARFRPAARRNEEGARAAPSATLRVAPPLRRGQEESVGKASPTSEPGEVAPKARARSASGRRYIARGRGRVAGVRRSDASASSGPRDGAGASPRQKSGGPATFRHARPIGRAVPRASKKGVQSSSGHRIVRTGSASSPGPITALSVTSRETPPISA